MWGRRFIGGGALASVLVLLLSSVASAATPKDGHWGGSVKHSAYNTSLNITVKHGGIKVLYADFSSAEVALCSYGQETGTAVLRNVKVRHGTFSANAKLAQTSYPDATVVVSGTFTAVKKMKGTIAFNVPSQPDCAGTLSFSAKWEPPYTGGGAS